MLVSIADLPEATNKKEIVTLAPNTVIRAAAQMMTKKKVGAAPVLDKEGHLIGILSERDIMTKVTATSKKHDNVLVEDVMTPNPQTIRLQDSLTQATEYMIKGGYRHLPVVDQDNVLTGMLSLRDFMALNWSQMISQTGKHTVMAFLNSPQLFAMLIGVFLYSAVIFFFV